MSLRPTNLRKEERRLRRTIGALLATLAPLAVAEACGTDSAGSGADAGSDATLDHAQPNDDANTDTEAAADGNADDGPDASFDANCTSIITVLDAGMDGDAYADPSCSYALSCGIMGVVRTSGCQVQSITSQDAAPTPLGCWVVADTCAADVYVPDANVTVQCMDCIGGGGRRPVGLRRARSRGSLACRTELGTADTAGDYFCAMAFEEEAAVLAFQRMSAELELHGAPASLRSAARRATGDERRHAKTFRALALRHGRAPRASRLDATPRRALTEIAAENAAEGCVRETFGALLLAVQAARATEPGLRATFARIADEETRHAALSWAVSRWAEPKLSPAARKKVEAARASALRTLRDEIARREPRAYDARVGHPSREESRRLLDQLAASVNA